MGHVILLPGLLCDAALWQGQAVALRGQVAVSTIPVDQHDNMTALAAQILVQAPAQFALAGLSMGGYVAMEIMRQAPERVTHLALFDTSARSDTPEQKEKRQGLLRLAKMGKFKGVTPRLLPSLLHPTHLQDATITATVMAMAARIGRDGFLRQQTAILGRIDSRPHLPAIACPTLIAVGAEDQLTPPAIAQEMAALVPGARLEIIASCGHLAPLEQPEKTTALLQTWLAR